jgi:Uma2 family endonuclease
MSEVIWMSSPKDYEEMEIQLQEQEQEQQQHESGGLPGAVEMLLGSYITQFVYARRLGWVFGADTEFEVAGFKRTAKRFSAENKEKPGRKQPDISFVSIERLPAIPRGVIRVAPDLVVEIYSEFDNPYAMADKIKEYLVAGVKLVWVVNPAGPDIDVYQAGQAKVLKLRIDDMLEGGTVLPGFTLKLTEVFGRLVEAPAEDN